MGALTGAPPAKQAGPLSAHLNRDKRSPLRAKASEWVRPKAAARSDAMPLGALTGAPPAKQAGPLSAHPNRDKGIDKF